MISVRVATEGRLDLAVATRLLEERGATAVPSGARNGRSQLLSRLNDYNAGARREHWFVLIDLDTDECAPTLLAEHIPQPSAHMTIRVAVREIEAWFLADPGFARYIRVAVRHLPAEVETLQSPKRWLIELVRSRCRTKSIRSAILPALRDAAVGEDYNDFMIDFVRDQWDPIRSAERSDSLRRCLSALDALTA